MMSLPEIEAAIQQLSEEEVRQLSVWLQDYLMRCGIGKLKLILNQASSIGSLLKQRRILRLIG